jgi:hypothetical protein
MNQGAEVCHSGNWLDVLGNGVHFLVSVEIFPSTTSNSGSGTNTAICQWVQGILTWVNQARQEAEHSSSTAEVIIATCPYVFIAWCLFKHDSFTFFIVYLVRYRMLYAWLLGVITDGWGKIPRY